MNLFRAPEENDVPRESNRVNLDALIVRQDMAGGQPKNVPQNFSFKHSDLLKQGGMAFDALRKPDFQRSTSSWTPEKVRDMVLAFIEDETVPGIIVWRSPSSDLFVIDGAHRLSSVIAWINDDYGDGDISKAHYGEPQNPTTAQKTRELIEGAIGSYKNVIEAVGNSQANPKLLATGKKLLFASLSVQELKKVSDAATAEKSFLKINEQGVVLSETEKWLINARNCPNAIAARAISVKGTGGSFWDKFADAQKKAKISKLSAEIYRVLFTPELDAGEIKTADLPVAGSFYSAASLGLIFQLVNFANDVPTKPPNNRADAEKRIPVDTDGGATIRFLEKTKRAASLLTNLRTTHYMRSLDLHPFVYFYSRQGSFQPTMFLATTYWLCDLDKNDKILRLMKNGLRGKLENFLLKHSFLVPYLSRKARGEEAAVRRIKSYLDFLLDNVSKKPTAKLLNDIGREFKVAITPEPEDDEPTLPGSKITVPIKNALFIEGELRAAKKCEICKARIPSRGISHDHRIDKKHGGKGTKSNAAPTHHACNGSKDAIRKLNVKKV
jgi:hypothetical protein